MGITKVKFVHAFDPCGKLILEACGAGWSGDGDIPHFTESEYLRGQCETVCNGVRLLRPDESECEWEILMERAYRLIQAAAVGRLDDMDPSVALSDFADEYPQRFLDDYILGDEPARDAFASDALNFQAAAA